MNSTRNKDLYYFTLLSSLTSCFNKSTISKVFEHLNDSQGNTIFQEQLKGLALTGWGQENLCKILDARQPEERAWAACEALGLAFLEEKHNIFFPWNMERDKRNPFASLPGADIVGFIGEGSECRFALGEVKSSSEEKSPPQVMAGRNYSSNNNSHTGMGYQIFKLANDLRTMYQLIKWMLMRVKNTTYEQDFSQATTAFLNSGYTDFHLYGILIRDTKTNEKDLCGLGEAIQKEFKQPTTCSLIALYLPWAIQELNSKIRNGGVS